MNFRQLQCIAVIWRLLQRANALPTLTIEFERLDDARQIPNTFSVSTVPPSAPDVRAAAVPSAPDGRLVGRQLVVPLLSADDDPYASTASLPHPSRSQPPRVFTEVFTATVTFDATSTAAHTLVTELVPPTSQGPPPPFSTSFLCPGRMPDECSQEWADSHPDRSRPAFCHPGALIEYCKHIPTAHWTIPVATASVPAVPGRCPTGSAPECKELGPDLKYHPKYYHGAHDQQYRNPAYCDQSIFNQICYLWDEPTMRDLASHPFPRRPPPPDWREYLAYPMQWCQSRYFIADEKVDIFGANWDERRLEPDGDGLRRQLQGCSAVTAWRFQRFNASADPPNASFPWQFHAHATTIVGKHGCVGRAMHSAGAPRVAHCDYANGARWWAWLLAGVGLGPGFIFRPWIMSNVPWEIWA